MALKHSDLLPAELAIQTAEFSRRNWQWKIPAKWKYEDLLNPEAYKLVGDKLAAGDCITVIGELHDFDCDLRVVSADRGYCLVRPIRTWFSNAINPSNESGEPKVQFVPGRGYLVISATGAPVSSHLVEHEAQAALQAHLKDVAEKALAHA